MKKIVYSKDNPMNRLIKEKRESLKLSRAELAELLGKTELQILRWERGIHRPPIENIRMLCKILSITANELLGIKIVKHTDSPEEGVIYDWEIKKYGIYWACPKCGEKNAYYDEGLKDDVTKLDELVVECENVEVCNGVFSNWFNLSKYRNK